MERRIVTPKAEPFNERRLDSAGETEITQGLPEPVWGAETDAVLDGGEPVTAVMLNQLSIKQTSRDLPMLTVWVSGLNPLAKVSGESLEIERQAIARKDG